MDGSTSYRTNTERERMCCGLSLRRAWLIILMVPLIPHLLLRACSIPILKMKKLRPMVTELH